MTNGGGASRGSSGQAVNLTEPHWQLEIGHSQFSPHIS